MLLIVTRPGTQYVLVVAEIPVTVHIFPFGPREKIVPHPTTARAGLLAQQPMVDTKFSPRAAPPWANLGPSSCRCLGAPPADGRLAVSSGIIKPQRGWPPKP
jgi:hypothetical protein